MTASTFLQIFFIIDVFVIGVLSATVFRHAYAHFRPQKQKTEKLQTPTPNIYIPPAVKERLIKASQAQFQTVLNHSADELQDDLKGTSDQINDLLSRLATEIIAGELERYREDLDKLHKQAEVDLSGVKKEIEGHQAELKAQLAKEMEAEKQLLIQKIDTKLADAVGSFLLETLQHNVDLGNQGEYLLAMLEQHKADFVKEVQDEA